MSPDTTGPHAAPLSAEDATILALEAGNVRGHTCKVIVLAEPRGVDELRERVAARLGREPLLRMRLADGDPPTWEPAGELDVAGLVHDAGRAPADAFETRVGELMATPLPRDRPLWALDVLALDDGRTALAWRIHHALADGMTTMRMVRSVLMDDGDGERSAGAAGPPSVAGSAPTTSKATAVGAPAGGTSAAPARSRLAPLRGALRLPAALLRELSPHASLHALDAEPGAARAVALAGFPLERAKRIAHSQPERATVNDVVLTAVAGGIRRWLGELGEHARSLRVKVPVSLHHPGDGHGNRDSFLCVDVPLDHDDPVERLRAVAAETRERKARRDADSVDSFFRDLAHLSSSLERHAEHWARSPRVFGLNVSNVPGPRGALSVLGAPVASLHSLAEIAHRHALRVAVVSAGDRLGFGLCADADAIGSPAPIAAGIEAELRVLSDATGVSGR
jgi:WS/DGAT/MGAT family acyltransferase